MEKVLLTPEETAEVMGIGRSKVYELMRQGALESVRIGGSRRVPTVAIEEYVRHLRHQVAELARP